MTRNQTKRRLLSPCRAAALAVATFALIAIANASPAAAFDIGPHSDITLDALTAEGFGQTASDVVVANNWLVDLYSNSSKIPQSGHAGVLKVLLGSLLSRRESWPDAVVKAAGRSHFDSSRDDVANAEKARVEWERMMRNTLRLVRDAHGRNAPLDALTVIGISLHEMQDFYSHSNWIEAEGIAGTDGPLWSTMPYGSNPTWFDVPAAVRQTLPIYIGETTGHTRTHGGWNTDKNKSMKKGVNKDWPGRYGYDNSYITSYFATRTWVRAIHDAIGDEAFWSRVSGFADRGGKLTYLIPKPNGGVRTVMKGGPQLNHDLKGALEIGLGTGHWQGEGEPCNPTWSRHVCGDRNGAGGNLLDTRGALQDFFGPQPTQFRAAFERLIVAYGADDPGGDLLPVGTSQPLQRTTRFVKVTNPRIKAIDLGDPGPDDADMYVRARVGGQGFYSAVINSYDTFSFRKPYAPFESLKAVPANVSSAEPVTRMHVQIRTGSDRFSGTDDDVYLRINGGQRFPLDKRLYDDFERGDRDTYSVPIDKAVRAGLNVGDIQQVQIEKSRDGVAGGWKLGGVKLTVNGRVIYANGHINRWLEKNTRTWRATDFTPSSPRINGVPVVLDLWDDDSFVYGGDDHGDVDPDDKRKTRAFSYTIGAVLAGRSTGGSNLKGRLGDSDKAQLGYRITTLTPTSASSSKPDLVISNMGWDASNGYFFTVANVGSAAAAPFSVSVSGYGSFPIAGLAAGQSQTVGYTSVCTNGIRTATADAASQVDEADEANNARSDDVLCVL